MCGASILWRIPCCGHSAHGWLPRRHQFPFFRPSKSTQFCSGRPLFSLLWSSPAVLMQLNPPAASQVVQWQRVHLPVQGNLAETTLAFPHKEEAKHSRRPTPQNLPRWKLNTKKTQCRGSDEKPSVLKTRTGKSKLSRKLTQLSLTFQKTSG